ncbi:hypothetical protein RB597_003701 [Gaeumannomyces tritici]
MATDLKIPSSELVPSSSATSPPAASTTAAPAAAATKLVPGAAVATPLHAVPVPAAAVPIVVVVKVAAAVPPVSPLPGLILEPRGRGDGRPLDPDGGLLHLGVPARVRALPARPPIRAEAAEVVRAQLAPHVLLCAPRPQRAEALVVVRTRGQLGLRVDVEIHALLAVLAEAVAEVKVALGHLAQVVLVQELAAIALLAQAAEPVLADHAVEGRAVAPLAASAAAAARKVVGEGGVGDVALQAARAVGAVTARRVHAADGPVGRQAVLCGAAVMLSVGRSLGV